MCPTCVYVCVCVFVSRPEQFEIALAAIHHLSMALSILQQCFASLIRLLAQYDTDLPLQYSPPNSTNSCLLTGWAVKVAFTRGGGMSDSSMLDEASTCERRCAKCLRALVFVWICRTYLLIQSNFYTFAVTKRRTESNPRDAHLLLMLVHGKEGFHIIRLSGLLL